jgi:hypothetical protein
MTTPSTNLDLRTRRSGIRRTVAVLVVVVIAVLAGFVSMVVGR